MAGILEFEDWLADFDAQWTAPIQEMALALADEQALQQWYSTPPQVHAQVQKADPAKYATAKAMIERIERDHASKTPGAAAIPPPAPLPNQPGASVIPAPAGPVVPGPTLPEGG
jgi:hypothetical protein